MRSLPLIFYSFVLILIFCCGGLFFLINYPTVDLEQQRLTAHNAPTIVLDDEGNEWARFQLDRREPIPLTQIPHNAINAFLAAEDRQFFHHHGISWRGIVRSTLINLRHGRVVQGASTITQQLVKLIFLSNERTLVRKIKEQFMALVLEFQYSKEQIIEAYLNTIYCGAGIYGIQAAAQRFWGINAQELSLAQCALIAGLVRSPENYCPTNGKANNGERCLRRRNLVLSLMRDQHFITQKEYETAVAEPLNVRHEKIDTSAPHARELVRQTVEAIVGREQLYAGGLVIKTTINTSLQKNAARLFKQRVVPLRTKAPVDGACITIDTRTRAIKALVGGFNFAESQFNRATQARRQMGSIFKPLVYAAAMQQGVSLTETALDEPLNHIQNWNPRNVNRTFEGAMTLARALITSNNIIAITTFLRVGADAVIDLARRCHLPGPFVPYPSLALGCTDCSLLEATAMYATWAEQGVYEQPYVVEWIKDRWGKKLWKHQPAPEQALPPELCSKMVQALHHVPAHLTQRLESPWLSDLGVESMGKTGTTNESRNCWFIGATPSYVTGIYLGCDDNRPLGGIVSSTRTCAPLWCAINRTIAHPVTTFSIAPRLQKIAVDPRSGQRLQPQDTRGILLLE